MDLIDYRNRFGHQAVVDLFTSVLPRWLLSQVINGHKGLSLDKAKLLVKACPELDVIKLMEMRERCAKLRAAKKTATPDSSPPKRKIKKKKGQAAMAAHEAA